MKLTDSDDLFEKEKNPKDDEKLFADEPDTEEVEEQEEKDEPTGCWKILVVDDEEDIHSVTRMALKGFTYQDKEIEFLDTFSGEESKPVLRENPDIAVIRQRLEQVERVIAASAAYAVEQAMVESGPEAAEKVYRDLLADETRSRYFDEREFNAFGYRLLGRGRMDAAVRVFTWNVEMNPESANAYDSLGEAYMKAGDRRAAIDSYEDIVPRDPRGAIVSEEVNEEILEQLRSLGYID